jgi:predicted HTH transcriptional regulator
MPYTAEQVRGLISEGEGPHVEFKRNLPQPGILAKNVSAFANGEGGVIIVGVDDSAKVVGTDSDRVQVFLSREAGLLSPNPITSFETVELDGKSLGVIEVMRNDEPVSTDEGGFYVRHGATVMPMDSEELRVAVTRGSEEDPLLKLTRAVTRQTHTIDRLRRDLDRASRLRRKITDWIMGGIVGAVIGAVITAAVAG